MVVTSLVIFTFVISALYELHGILLDEKLFIAPVPEIVRTPSSSSQLTLVPHVPLAVGSASE